MHSNFLPFYHIYSNLFVHNMNQVQSGLVASMKPIKIKFQTIYGDVEFYNTLKGTKNFMILLNIILEENEFFIIEGI